MPESADAVALNIRRGAACRMPAWRIPPGQKCGERQHLPWLSPYPCERAIATHAARPASLRPIRRFQDRAGRAIASPFTATSRRGTAG